jgi:hypothetical protein
MQANKLTGFIGALGKWGLTGISGAATTYSTSATTLPFAINSKALSKAQVSGGTTPTTGAVSASAITLTANQGRVVVWGMNAAGTVQVIEGSVYTLDSAGSFIVAPQFPAMPDTFCPCAYHVLQAGSTLSGTFTFGSSNWNTTGMTHTVVDLAGGMPDRPQTS